MVSVDYIWYVRNNIFYQMLVYWKKYEKVEKEHRKRAEKEAQEQRKLDDEFREVTNYYYLWLTYI